MREEGKTRRRRRRRQEAFFPFAKKEEDRKCLSEAERRRRGSVVVVFCCALPFSLSPSPWIGQERLSKVMALLLSAAVSASREKIPLDPPETSTPGGGKGIQRKTEKCREFYLAEKEKMIGEFSS